MSVSLRLRVTNIPQVQRALRDVAQGARDLRPGLRAVLEDFKAGQRDHFGSRGDGTWAPLSPSYAAYKTRRYGGRGILERTGRLRRAATGESDELRVTLDPQRLQASIGTPYAAYVARRRPLVAMTEQRLRRAGDRVREFLTRAVDAAARGASR